MIVTSKDANPWQLSAIGMPNAQPDK
jgi:hypothetical protein